jgi:hypothetical protein
VDLVILRLWAGLAQVVTNSLPDDPADNRVPILVLSWVQELARKLGIDLDNHEALGS